MQFEVICLETPAFEKLIQRLVDHIKQTNKISKDEWISSEEAMQMLHITSRTSLAKFRNNGWISFSCPTAKIILYSRNSINEFLLKHQKSTF